MAAVSDGNDKSLEDVDYDLQRHLKGVNTRTPDLSTLAQKGDEKVMQVSFLDELLARVLFSTSRVINLTVFKVNVISLSSG